MKGVTSKAPQMTWSNQLPVNFRSTDNYVDVGVIYPTQMVMNMVDKK